MCGAAGDRVEVGPGAAPAQVGDEALESGDTGSPRPGEVTPHRRNSTPV